MSRLRADRDIAPQYCRPMTMPAEMFLGPDDRLRQGRPSARLSLAALGLYGVIWAWPEGAEPTVAEVAAYTGAPLHEVDQLVAELSDHGYLTEVQ